MTDRRLLKFAATIALVYFGGIVLFWTAAGFVVLNWDVTTWTEEGRLSLLFLPLVVPPLVFAIAPGVVEDVL